MGQGNKTRKSFLNKSSGKKDTLEVDYDNNTVTVEDDSGITFASFKGGAWEADLPEYTEQILIDKGVYKDVAKTIFDESVQDNKDILSWSDSQNTETIDPNFFKDLTTSPLSAGDLGGGSVDVPRDPEGFFIGRYPLNQKDTNNFDYLKITCYDYEPGLFSGGDQFFKIDDIDKRVKKRRGVVSLPIQPGISESNSVNWGDNEINPLQLAGAGIAGAAMGGIADAISGVKGSGDDFFSRVGKTGRSALGSVDERLIKSFFAGQAVGANILGRGTGLTINNNVEVLFNGPNLRTFNYTYKFTPREPKEADHIKKIIRFFKKTMAPKRSTSRIFLKSPDVFKLKYTFKNGDSHPFLNNIKICALNGFTVDYTPDGSYSTYDDDGGRGDGSMTSYQVGISFMEMTPIYNDDFWNDDEGKEGTGF
tara:strand:- start:902 stop:2164 length:1263 start_codon:yes stop_codon:yes gene_type:complete